MKKVIMAHGERVQLAALFGVSTVTVRNALKFKWDSDLAKKIRKAAIERGGAEVDILTNQNLKK